MAGLTSVRGLDVLPRSVVRIGEAEVGAVRDARTVGGPAARVAALAQSAPAELRDLEGETSSVDGRWFRVGPMTPRNLAVVQRALPWLSPRPLELARSFGFGDRLGLATPGHIRAMRAAGAGIAPIFAQQSIREMVRTNRTPAQVLNDAAWGVFMEGWRDGFGADADHLKTTADVDGCLDAGYTFFTFDPGAYVDPEADARSAAAIASALDALPWRDLDDTRERMWHRYRGRTLELDREMLTYDDDGIARAAVKYGRAVAHVAVLYRHLRSRDSTVEVEISVDETDTPTTPVQHAYVATELRRLGVQWVSLAPRFVGRFEKGVDYIGDPVAFDRDAAVHAAIARRLGPYKLSLHSGSDKLSVYGAFGRRAGTLAHIKTAGTSYLEALRTIAPLDPALFRDIYVLAHERYGEDRASYHVSAAAERAPAPGTMADRDLASLLDNFDAREMLHVTFGSALAVYGPRLQAVLRANPDAYDASVERHFIRHLSAFGVPERGLSGADSAAGTPRPSG
ncbi:MAG TPA: tagaturonate epimerase family protein [bacterium]|nr:tagaturonate epimerase family protein [bacterium]